MQFRVCPEKLLIVVNFNNIIHIIKSFKKKKGKENVTNYKDRSDKSSKSIKKDHSKAFKGKEPGFINTLSINPFAASGKIRSLLLLSTSARACQGKHEQAASKAE